ncbi:hypothetical protein [Methylophaga pinxianii]|uniref:hypothetical protein n=1 Tax=Methylophaga pinxianii TaxID=2881052 RepID=UPI001CF25F79|nr:hypothetical protein [Methylophaga pinxianii]MCB2426166.1 hypothetical protein [Methylophaga pinxianii]UPH45036.1 hypothetical protein LGT42_010995 [Methylophaga pinxianii]
MSEEYAQQLIDILLLSENFQMNLNTLISKVAHFDSDSHADKACLAEAFDMLTREELIWLENEPVYENEQGLIQFNDMQVGLTKTGSNASIN